MFSFNTPATRTLPHMPFPDITKVYGRGYTNVRDSIRAYKPPVLSMKTQEQVNKEIISNAAGHQIRWSEAEIKRAVKHRLDDEPAVVDAGSEPDEEEEEEEEEETGGGGLSESKASETPIDTPEAAYERFKDAGLSRYDIPNDKESLKTFMKQMRDSKIVQIKYTGRSTATANRGRLLDKLGIHEGLGAFTKGDEDGEFDLDGARYKHSGEGRFEKVGRSKRRD